MYVTLITFLKFAAHYFRNFHFEDFFCRGEKREEKLQPFISQNELTKHKQKHTRIRSTEEKKASLSPFPEFFSFSVAQSPFIRTCLICNNVQSMPKASIIFFLLFFLLLKKVLDIMVMIHKTEIAFQSSLFIWILLPFFGFKDMKNIAEPFFLLAPEKPEATRKITERFPTSPESFSMATWSEIKELSTIFCTSPCSTTTSKSLFFFFFKLVLNSC